MADPQLIEFIKNNKVIQHGDFTLASGKKSSIYFDCKGITCDGMAQWLYVSQLYFKMVAITDFDAIGGLELGSVPISSVMTFYGQTQGHHLKSFIIRKQPKDHGTNKFIEGPIEPGMTCAIIEDTCTSGLSSKFAIERAKEFGLIPVVVGCILDRNEGSRELFQSMGLPFVYLLEKKDLE